MDSAGGTVTDGRDKNFQAVYKLKGKVKNTFGLELHKARDNKEVDDLLTILRCGVGSGFDIEKLKFNKIILMADADSDGKHIELLLVTLFHEYLEELINKGYIYIGISPLYKVSITGKPVIYLNTVEDLAKFFANTISEIYKFIDSNTEKEITKVDKKANFIATLLDYQKTINTYADKLAIDPHILEVVFIQNYNPETGDIDFGDRIEVSQDDNDNLNIVGYYVNEEDEYFVCLNTQHDIFVECVQTLYEKLAECTQNTLIDKKGNVYETDSIISMVNNIISQIKKNARVNRLKGLGEVNADELWITSLNPETRRLVQVQPVENSKDIVDSFMGNKADSRKEFLKSVFAEAIADSEEV